MVLERIFNAPRELVWKAWTDPKQMAQWFGPKYFTIPVCELDLKVGGALYLVMRGPKGTEHDNFRRFSGENQARLECRCEKGGRSCKRSS